MLNHRYKSPVFSFSFFSFVETQLRSFLLVFNHYFLFFKFDFMISTKLNLFQYDTFLSVLFFDFDLLNRWSNKAIHLLSQNLGDLTFSSTQDLVYLLCFPCSAFLCFLFFFWLNIFLLTHVFCVSWMCLSLFIHFCVFLKTHIYMYFRNKEAKRSIACKSCYL